MSLKEIRKFREIEDMTNALRKTNGDVQAAIKELKWSKSSFYRRVKSMGLTVKGFKKRVSGSTLVNKELSFL